MKISVKTLKGDKFDVEVDTNDTVGDVKRKIFESKGQEFVADRQKLIHSGKVLVDSSTITETGIKEGEYIVCMVTKDAAASKPKVAAAPAAPAVSAPPAAVTPQAAPPRVSAPQATPAVQAPAISDAAVQSLVEMGFVQEECIAALRAARGDSSLAVEFLMSGHIPDAALAPPRGPASSGGGGSEPSSIEQLRHHPQLNQLKRMVQQNPASLSQVLESIGQQNPDLLRAIHANQADFLALMNEPISEVPAGPAPGGYGEDDMGGDDMGGGDMGGNPMQLLQMLQSLPAEQRQQAAQQLGMSPEQLTAFTQMMASMPPEQLQQLMAQGGRGGGRAPGGAPGGGSVIRLSEDEMAAVGRLQELGFSQQEAATAFLACDKNEVLAANFLLNGGGGDDDFGGDFGDDDYA